MSNQQEGEKEDVDSDGKVGFFDSCDCAAALSDDSNKFYKLYIYGIASMKK
jgi:hypothetical protein